MRGGRRGAEGKAQEALLQPHATGRAGAMPTRNTAALRRLFTSDGRGTCHEDRARVAGAVYRRLATAVPFLNLRSVWSGGGSVVRAVSEK